MEASSRLSSEGKGAAATPALFVAAILLPPLAIFLDRGVGRDFWIGFALTCLGYVPGVAFALFALLNGSRRPAEA